MIRRLNLKILVFKRRLSYNKAKQIKKSIYDINNKIKDLYRQKLDELKDIDKYEEYYGKNNIELNIDRRGTIENSFKEKGYIDRRIPEWSYNLIYNTAKERLETFSKPGCTAPEQLVIKENMEQVIKRIEWIEKDEKN